MGAKYPRRPAGRAPARSASAPQSTGTGRSAPHAVAAQPRRSAGRAAELGPGAGRARRAAGRRRGAGRAPRPLRVGGQRVYFADSRAMDFVEDGTADFIMTSPPYWNLKDYGHGGQIGQSGYGEYLDDLNRVWDECYRIAKPNAVFVLNVGNRRHDKNYIPLGFDIYSRMRKWRLWDSLIWYIPNALPQPASYVERLFDNKYEFLLVFTKDGGRSGYTFHKPRVPSKYGGVDSRKGKMDPRGRCLGNVIRIPAYRPPNVRSLNYHAASYPEELVALMLHTMTDEGDTVLDPFLGSGTTLKVARAMGRRGIGVEINRGFEQVIRGKISERFEVPDWRTVDMMHSATMETGAGRPRKAHLLRDGRR